MKKGKSSTFLLSFLDVLSNALAAVFILAMVRMQPEPPGLSAGELYYIKVVREGKVSDRPIRLAAKFKSNSIIAHDAIGYSKTNARTAGNDKWSRINFLKEPREKDFEEIICYITDPDFSNNLGEECIYLDIKLPNRKIKKSFILNQSNDFRTHIYLKGEFNENSFILCDDKFADSE